MRVFRRLRTQWDRAGVDGTATGLKYGVLPAVFRLMGIARKEWSSLFDDLCVMEGAALMCMREQKQPT